MWELVQYIYIYIYATNHSVSMSTLLMYLGIRNYSFNIPLGITYIKISYLNLI